MGKERNPPRPATPDQLEFLALGETGELALDWGTMLLVDAYVELSTNRSMGYAGVGPIPAWAIRDWCRENGVAPDNTRHFRTVIRLVDAETLRRQQVAIRARSQPKSDE